MRCLGNRIIKKNSLHVTNFSSQLWVCNVPICMTTIDHQLQSTCRHRVPKGATDQIEPKLAQRTPTDFNLTQLNLTQLNWTSTQLAIRCPTELNSTELQLTSTALNFNIWAILTNMNLSTQHSLWRATELTLQPQQQDNNNNKDHCNATWWLTPQSLDPLWSPSSGQTQRRLRRQREEWAASCRRHKLYTSIPAATRKYSLHMIASPTEQQSTELMLGEGSFHHRGSSATQWLTSATEWQATSSYTMTMAFNNILL